MPIGLSPSTLLAWTLGLFTWPVFGFEPAPLQGSPWQHRAVPYGVPPEPRIGLPLVSGWASRLPRGTDATAARQLLEMLWEDQGTPSDNFTNQWFVLLVIGKYAPFMDDDARALLRQGLLDYWHNGGAQIAADPMRGAVFPEALIETGEPTDSAVQETLLDAILALADAQAEMSVLWAEAPASPKAPSIPNEDVSPELQRAREIMAENLSRLDKVIQQRKQLADKICQALGVTRDDELGALVYGVYVQCFAEAQENLRVWLAEREWNDHRPGQQASADGLKPVVGPSDSRPEQPGPESGSGAQPANHGSPGDIRHLDDLRSELRRLVRDLGDASRVRRIGTACRKTWSGTQQRMATKAALAAYRRVAASRRTATAVLQALEEELVRLLPEVQRDAGLARSWALAAIALAPRAGQKLLPALQDARRRASDAAVRNVLKVCACRLEQVTHPSEKRRAAPDKTGRPRATQP